MELYGVAKDSLEKILGMFVDNRECQLICYAEALKRLLHSLTIERDNRSCRKWKCLLKGILEWNVRTFMSYACCLQMKVLADLLGPKARIGNLNQ